MIHDEIVTYEVAKLAKEKGFPQHIGNDAYVVENEYDVEYEVGSCYPIQFIPDYLPTITAPTQSLLQRWLREEKSVNISIDSEEDFGGENLIYEWQASHKKYIADGSFILNPVSDMEFYSTYEKALEYALKYALENLT